MKRVLLVLAALSASVMAACGGGSGTPPPPPVGGFTNASLKGTYAFSMSGTDINGFFARVGSFTADGNGNITGGVEDFADAGLPEQLVVFSASTYSIQADGQGTMTLVNAANANAPLILSISLNSITQGLVVQTDGNATASGNFTIQNLPAIALSGISGGYVFDFSGEDPSGAPDSIIGQFQANGGGGVSTGIYDENDNGAPSGPLTFSTGTFTADPTYFVSNGRGTFSFAGFVYVFYMVDGTRLRFIEQNQSALTFGDAVAQNSAPTTNAGFTGSFAFLQGGTSSSGPLTQGARFTADGNGNLSNIALLDNDAGNVQTVPKGSISAATYAIDTTNPGTGRGTLTFTDSSLGTYRYIFYLSSASKGVIQNNSNQRVADGNLNAQTGGPFNIAGLAGKYALNFSGVSTNSSTQVTAEEDYVGQVTIANGSSSNVSGSVIFNAFNSNQGTFPPTAVTGNLALTGDGTQANTLSVTVKTAPSSTINFNAFILNPSTIYVVSTDKNRSTAGVLLLQSQ